MCFVLNKHVWQPKGPIPCVVSAHAENLMQRSQIQTVFAIAQDLVQGLWEQ